MSELNKVMEKIRRLLALSESPNANEAEQASIKAFELMAKYDISMSSLVTEKQEIVELDLTARTRSISTEKTFVATVLKQFFNCQIVNYKDRLGSRFVLVGKSHHVEVGRHVFSFLNRAAESSFEQYKKGMKYGSRKELLDRKIIFYSGFFKGVCAKLEAAKVNLQEQGLVLVEDADLKEYMDKSGVTTSKHARKVTYSSETDREQGYKSGFETDLFAAVNSSKSPAQIK